MTQPLTDPNALQTVEEFSIRELQEKLPWSIRYSADFQANPQTHKDFNHAVLHVIKATGKLAAMSEDADHERSDFLEAEKYIADIVICALRMANTLPIGAIDVYSAVVNRMQTKNNVKL